MRQRLRELRKIGRERRLARRLARRERRARKRQAKRLRAGRLQAKLMRSYLFVTVAAVLTIISCGGGLLWLLFFRSAPTPQNLETSAREVATEIAPILRKPRWQLAALEEPLRRFSDNRITAVVTDRSGVVVYAAPENAARTGKSLSSQMPFSPRENAAFQSATLDSSDAKRSGINADASTFALVRVLDTAQNATQNAPHWLFVRSFAPVQPHDFGRAMIRTILVSGVLVALFGAVVGSAFGFWTARRLTARLQAISHAANAWSRGEFNTLASDNSNDEIGELARRLNQMARELQQLVALRQNLATAEERNRLARDLHDTVKQQLFATTMQVAAARALLESDVQAAQMRLVEAEKLAQGAQRELTGILEQLRPAASLHDDAQSSAPRENEDFVETLRETVTQWSRQSEIAADFMCDEALKFSAPRDFGLIAQAFLRILQEALANVWRHSNARRVRVQLRLENAISSTRYAENCVLKMTIEDDGDGFSPTGSSRGMGLTHMRERAEALCDGRFSLQSERGQGTRIEVCCTVFESEKI